MEANEKPVHRGQTDNGYMGCKPAATGDVVRRQRAGVQEGPTFRRRVSNSERGRSACLPQRGIDQLRLMWQADVGAAIVVRDSERLLQGEGPQGLERNLSVRIPKRERSVDV